MSGPPDAPPEITADAFLRLEKRLRRERAARLEAEAIAEKGLRELWSRQRELVMLKAVARTANEARSGRQALSTALRLVCEFTEWPIGHVYVASARRAGRNLAPTDIWFGADTAKLRAFRRASEALHFAGEEGLPGRVLASGAPVWISPLHADPHFPRGLLAFEAGLGSGLAFPVHVKRRVAAVLEFFTPQLLEPDEKLLEIMAKVGDHLGRAIERERAQDSLRAKNAKLRNALHDVEEKRRAAEAASRAKSSFLAVTSHEVRTPLNAVLGLAEGLRRESLSERQGELVEGIIESGSMLLRLLNSVLDLSRIESGDQILIEEDFTLEELLAPVERLWRVRAEELGVQLALDAGPLVLARRVRTDRSKLEQIATNLVSNALKFTPPGGVVTLRARAAESGLRTRVELDVIDSGPGVPDDAKRRIFEPYAQTSAGRAAGGAGLGLTVCAGHVKLMGGEISVEDAPGCGAAFRVRLTLEKGQPPPEAPGSVPASDMVDPGQLRVLAAEDNESNRRVLALLLEPAGLSLTFAENGAEAVEAFQREPFEDRKSVV